VLELYASGRTVLDIAAELQIPVGRASRLLGHALTEEPASNVPELRAATSARLDKAARDFSELARTATDDRVRLQALQGYRATEADRARLLGLNAKPGPE
jgi:hypothetical protein